MLIHASVWLGTHTEQKFFPTPSLLGRKASAEKGGGQKKRGSPDPTDLWESKLGPHERFVPNFGPSV